MANLEDENDRLRRTNSQLTEENSHLKAKAHETSVAIRLILFFAACGVVYFLERISPLAAYAFGLACFYLLFMR